MYVPAGRDAGRGREVNEEDIHSDNFEGTRRQGLLDQTLVVLVTEFGRIPCIDGNDAWEHHLLAGVGISGCEAKRNTHSDNSEGTQDQSAVVDQAMSTLLADLQAKRLLDQAPVVLGTWFGRTSRVSDNEGRATPTATASGAPHGKQQFWTRR